jgi:replication factor C subunit 3/5
MAYDQVTEQAVFLTAGAAMPAVIEAIYTSLMNENFEMAYRALLKNIVDFGYALCDIVTEVSILVAATELPDAVMSHLMDKLSNVEFRLANGVSEKLQIGAVVGAFTIARAMLTAPSPSVPTSGEKK